MKDINVATNALDIFYLYIDYNKERFYPSRPPT
jgi:hypothetical protein